MTHLRNPLLSQLAVPLKMCAINIRSCCYNYSVRESAELNSGGNILPFAEEATIVAAIVTCDSNASAAFVKSKGKQWKKDHEQQGQMVELD